MAPPPELPSDLRYTSEHEWVRREGAAAVVGITAFAQAELGDVVYLELPAVGARVVAGTRLGEIESVKTVSEVFAPVTGEVIDVNEALRERPELVNSDPYGDGWMVRVQLADAAELDALLDAAAYAALLPEA
ncbi:MAG: glycine cleavage system protein GcvH [Dehalococcoidia bacterium]|nr:glycine cleavage system protein GcvH [Dehalococcoidia bacterium]